MMPWMSIFSETEISIDMDRSVCFYMVKFFVLTMGEASVGNYGHTT